MPMRICPPAGPDAAGVKPGSRADAVSAARNATVATLLRKAEQDLAACVRVAHAGANFDRASLPRIVTVRTRRVLVPLGVLVLATSAVAAVSRQSRGVDEDVPSAALAG